MKYLHVLTGIFIVLKLMGVITWSWWLVLLPTILTIVFALFLLFAVVTVYSPMRFKMPFKRK